MTKLRPGEEKPPGCPGRKAEPCSDPDVWPPGWHVTTASKEGSWEPEAGGGGQAQEEGPLHLACLTTTQAGRAWAALHGMGAVLRLETRIVRLLLLPLSVPQQTCRKARQQGRPSERTT